MIWFRQPFGRFPLTLAALLVAAGDTPPAMGQEASPTARAEAILKEARPAIEAANTEWIPALVRGDFAAAVADYADDGVLVSATGESIRGRDAIVGYLRERISKAGKVIGGQVIQEGLAVVGDRIYEWGRGETQMIRSSQDVVRVGGRYLTVWQRDASGRWRIFRNLSLAE